MGRLLWTIGSSQSPEFIASRGQEQPESRRRGEDIQSLNYPEFHVLRVGRRCRQSRVRGVWVDVRVIISVMMGCDCRV